MIIIMKEYIVNWSFSVSLRFGYFLEYTWNIIFGYILPTNYLKGSWKYSSRFIYIDNNIIFAELGDGKGGWNKQSIPLDEEYLYHNKNGFFSK